MVVIGLHILRIPFSYFGKKNRFQEEKREKSKNFMIDEIKDF